MFNGTESSAHSSRLYGFTVLELTYALPWGRSRRSRRRITLD